MILDWILGIAFVLALFIIGLDAGLDAGTEIGKNN